MLKKKLNYSKDFHAQFHTILRRVFKVKFEINDFGCKTGFRVVLFAAGEANYKSSRTLRVNFGVQIFRVKI